MAQLSLAVYGGMFVYIAVRHVLYPGFTEAMEGAILQHIERAAHGRTIYPMPGPDFIALNYMPLYYFVAAPFYYMFGDSLAGPRMLSSIAAVLSGGIVGRIAWRESRSATIGCLAAALYFAGYRVMDDYLTCALPDTLLLLWLLLGFWFLAYGTTWMTDVLWLVFYSLAFWTKQHGALFFGFALLYALFLRKPAGAEGPIRSRLPKWALLIGFLLGGPISYWLVGRLLGEGFFFYTLAVPGRWERSMWFSIRRTVFVLASFVPLASLLGVVYLKHSTQVSLRSLRGWSVSALGWFTVTALLSVAITMTASGASNNQYIPLIAALSAAAALGVHSLVRSGEPAFFRWWLMTAALLMAGITVVAARLYPDHPIPVAMPLVVSIVIAGYTLIFWRRLPESWGRVVTALLLVLGQFAISYYPLRQYLPEPGYQEGIARLRQELARLDAPTVWIDYGNVPAALTETKLASAPSWVILDDLERQVKAPPGEVDRQLAPFRDWAWNSQGLYLLSIGRIESVPGWNFLADNVSLVKDFGEEFAGVRQIAVHWYGGRSYPRYLYRTRGMPQLPGPPAPLLR